ncbi:MAG: SOS response-associated peptidase [Marinifilaceae bacterium]
MCFFVSLASPKKAIEDYLHLTYNSSEEFVPSYYFSGFDHPYLPVLAQSDPDRLQMMSWGLVPAWAQDEETASSIRNKTLNARMETVQQKVSFRKAVSTQRCLIPINGFFEWQSRKNRKYPYYIYMEDRPIFCLAGIFDCWVYPGSEEILMSFSILTREANPFMAEIHNTSKRMPAILDQKQESVWIDTLNSEERVLFELGHFSGDKLKAHTISPLINRKGVNRNTVKIIEPFYWEPGSLF